MRHVRSKTKERKDLLVRPRSDDEEHHLLLCGGTSILDLARIRQPRRQALLKHLVPRGIVHDATQHQDHLGDAEAEEQDSGQEHKLSGEEQHEECLHACSQQDPRREAEVIADYGDDRCVESGQSRHGESRELQVFFLKKASVLMGRDGLLVR